MGVAECEEVGQACTSKDTGATALALQSTPSLRSPPTSMSLQNTFVIKVTQAVVTMGGTRFLPVCPASVSVPRAGGPHLSAPH